MTVVMCLCTDVRRSFLEVIAASVVRGEADKVSISSLELVGVSDSATGYSYPYHPIPSS